MYATTLPTQETNNTTQTDASTVIYLADAAETAPSDEIDYDTLRAFYAAGF